LISPCRASKLGYSCAQSLKTASSTPLNVATIFRFDVGCFAWLLALYFVDVIGANNTQASVAVTVWLGVGLLGDFA